MRMPPHQLLRNFAKDLLDVEATCFACNLRVHDYQQQQIAEFLAKMRVVFRARGLRHFVSLFNQGRQQRFMRLLPVPWATAGRAQPRDDFAKLREVIGDLRSVIRRALGIFTVHGSPITDHAFKSATASGVCRTRRFRRRIVC